MIDQIHSTCKTDVHCDQQAGECPKGQQSLPYGPQRERTIDIRICTRYAQHRVYTSDNADRDEWSSTAFGLTPLRFCNNITLAGPALHPNDAVGTASRGYRRPIQRDSWTPMIAQAITPAELTTDTVVWTKNIVKRKDEHSRRQSMQRSHTNNDKPRNGQATAR